MPGDRNALVSFGLSPAETELLPCTSETGDVEYTLRFVDSDVHPQAARFRYKVHPQYCGQSLKCKLAYIALALKK